MPRPFLSRDSAFFHVKRQGERRDHRIRYQVRLVYRRAHRRCPTISRSGTSDRNRCPCPRHLGELTVEAQENVAITSLCEMQRLGKIPALAPPFDCSRTHAAFLDGDARPARQPATPAVDLRCREAITAAQPPPASKQPRPCYT